jgi:hypothetical protein
VVVVKTEKSRHGLFDLAKRYGINHKTVAKRKRWSSVCDQPMGPMPQEPAQRGANLDARRRLARTQDHGDCVAALGVVDMDRQNAAFVVVAKMRVRIMSAKLCVTREGRVDRGNNVKAAPRARADARPQKATSSRHPK